MIVTILVVILIVWLLGNFAPLNNGSPYIGGGPYVGGIGTLLIILLVLYLLHVI